MTITPTHTMGRSDRLHAFRKLLDELAKLSDSELEELAAGALPPVVIPMRVHVRRAEEPALGRGSAHT